MLDYHPTPARTDSPAMISSIAPSIQQEGEPVLIMSADVARSRILCSAVALASGTPTLVSSIEEVLRLAEQQSWTLLVLDMAQQPAGTETAFRALRRCFGTRDAIMLAVFSQTMDERPAAEALQAGADDCVLTMSSALELYGRLRIHLNNRQYRETLGRLRSERDLLRREARVDPLTQLANRRATDQALSEHLRLSVPFALLYLDLDHFKSLNDRYGHAAGDEVLKTIAAAMQREGGGQLCGRQGGEEFVMLLDVASMPEAARRAERLRRVIAATPILAGSATVYVTVSIGVAFRAATGAGESRESLLSRADLALYEAKGRGRNCVAVAPDWLEGGSEGTCH